MLTLGPLCVCFRSGRGLHFNIWICLGLVFLKGSLCGHLQALTRLFYVRSKVQHHLYITNTQSHRDILAFYSSDFWVCSGAALGSKRLVLGQLLVRHSRPEADLEQSHNTGLGVWLWCAFCKVGSRSNCMSYHLFSVINIYVHYEHFPFHLCHENRKQNSQNLNILRYLYKWICNYKLCNNCLINICLL